MGNASCAGMSTCAGTSTCIGTNTCAGTATCIGSNTCVGTSTCFATGCNLQNPSQPTEPLPENPTPPANDGKTPSPWAEEAVSKGIELNLVPPCLQKNYQSNITREEYCELAIQFVRKILEHKPHLLQKLDEDPGKVFDDTDNYAVGHAYKLGIVAGVGNNKFEPARGISRQEAAKLMLNFNTEMLGLNRDGEVTPFADEADIADWAKAGVDFVVKSGLMKGVGDNKFAPQNSYTREQSIITMVRLYKEIFDE
ncbi:hypothetical protein C3V36_03820 [Lachnospiraceae bacterium oral taxon 500]|nr:hypothetical protein C3V36_03820 [Lachnospiraceae bacterium oral taxon 500]